jgi:cytochrome c oxidase assembly protein subunit 15
MRRLLHQAPTRFFACNQCLSRQPTATSRIVNLIRARSYASQTAQQPTTTPLNQLAQDMYTRAPEKEAEKGKRTFPETSSKSVAYWLLGSAASVFGIVVFGGLTRLTESG